jgi:hypothetical protein
MTQTEPTYRQAYAGRQSSGASSQAKDADVLGEGAGEADRLGGLVEGLVAGDAELVLEMEVGGAMTRWISERA